MRYHGYSKQRAIDGASKLLAFGIGKVRRKKKFPEKIGRIIIFKLGSIGDSILALPMIRTLKRRTGAKIILVHSKENKDVFYGHEFIDETILLNVTGNSRREILKEAYKVSKLKVDVAIDLSYSGNSSAILSNASGRYNLGFFNKKTPSRNGLFDEVIKINPREHVVLSYFRILKALKVKYSTKDIWLERLKHNLKSKKFSKKIIGIHCCHQIKIKSWPEKNFIDLINYLTSKNWEIILVGSPGEKRIVDRIYKKIKDKRKVSNFAGQTTIPEIVSLVKKLKLFIANDGGLMHIAAAMNVPTIGIFGPETPVRYAPFNRKSFAFYIEEKGGPQIKAYESKWPRGLFRKNLWVGYKEVKELLEERFL